MELEKDFVCLDKYMSVHFSATDCFGLLSASHSSKDEVNWWSSQKAIASELYVKFFLVRSWLYDASPLRAFRYLLQDWFTLGSGLAFLGPLQLYQVTNSRRYTILIEMCRQYQWPLMSSYFYYQFTHEKGRVDGRKIQLVFKQNHLRGSYPWNTMRVTSHFILHVPWNELAIFVCLSNKQCHLTFNPNCQAYYSAGAILCGNQCISLNF